MKLEEGKDSAFMSLELAKMRFDVPVKFDPEALRFLSEEAGAPNEVAASMSPAPGKSIIRIPARWTWHARARRDAAPARRQAGLGRSPAHPAGAKRNAMDPAGLLNAAESKLRTVTSLGARNLQGHKGRAGEDGERGSQISAK